MFCFLSSAGRGNELGAERIWEGIRSKLAPSWLVEKKFGKTKRTGAFHSTKNSEISLVQLNGTVKIPGKVFENLGIRFEYTLGAFHSIKITGSNFRWSNGTGTTQNSRSHALQLRAWWVKLFAVLEQHDCETISCTILYRNDDVILQAAITYLFGGNLLV